MGDIASEVYEERPRLDGSTTEQRFAAFVDKQRRRSSEAAKTLLPLLSVSHEVFRGRSAGSATRMRAYAMAALHDSGLPNDALPYVVEVLETSFRPNLVAATARAIRGGAAPDARLADYLVRAIYNIWQNDQPVSFEVYDVAWPLASFSTALSEVLDAIAWLGSSAHHAIPDLEVLLSAYSARFSPEARAAIARCIESLRSYAAITPRTCCGLAPLIEPGIVTTEDDLNLSSIELEDQDGHKFEWGHFFHGKPSLVAFFYATCMNPRKCVQTIYNLVEIHKGLLEAGLDHQIRVAAISYDPHRDTAAVLRQYGESKGVPFGTNFKMMRVPSQLDSVVDAFDLGVNYAGNQVNDHRIELYLLDGSGRIAHRFLRLQADPGSVVAELARLANAPRNKHVARHPGGAQ
ncbi:SCO family protein [Mesorhizobium sp. M1005]|uniref:SCO family protein n=1 Tax=unclassified Mesorhizobium TaxID=325217 RepID=UPI003339C8E4